MPVVSGNVTADLRLHFLLDCDGAVPTVGPPPPASAVVARIRLVFARLTRRRPLRTSHCYRSTRLEPVCWPGVIARRPLWWVVARRHRSELTVALTCRRRQHRAVISLPSDCADTSGDRGSRQHAHVSFDTSRRPVCELDPRCATSDDPLSGPHREASRWRRSAAVQRLSHTSVADRKHLWTRIVEPPPPRAHVYSSIRHAHGDRCSRPGRVAVWPRIVTVFTHAYDTSTRRRETPPAHIYCRPDFIVLIVPHFRWVRQSATCRCRASSGPPGTS